MLLFFLLEEWISFCVTFKFFYYGCQQSVSLFRSKFIISSFLFFHFYPVLFHLPDSCLISKRLHTNPSFSLARAHAAVGLWSVGILPKLSGSVVQWSWQHGPCPGRTSLFLRGWRWAERLGEKAAGFLPAVGSFPSRLRFSKRKKQASRAFLGVGMWKHPSLLRAQLPLQLRGVPCPRSALDLILFSPPPLPACVSIL